jgi:ribosomal protein L33
MGKITMICQNCQSKIYTEMNFEEIIQVECSKCSQIYELDSNVTMTKA